MTNLLDIITEYDEEAKYGMGYAIVVRVADWHVISAQLKLLLEKK